MKGKKITFSVVTFLLSMMLLLALSETLLRLVGFVPWTYSSKDSNEPTTHQPDPALGWRSKTGTYVIPAYAPSEPEIHMTFLDDGSRLTGDQSPPSGNTLVTVGGSFTQGWAISDDETYPWKLQEKFPPLKVVNYGTGGYGSYQSLLLLETQLPRLKSPRIVVYGFVEGHERRNVAAAGWLRNLSLYSQRAHVYVPYATLDKHNRIVRHAPERYVALPMREYLATVAYLEFIYMNAITRKREARRTEVTEQILLDINKVCEKFGATLIVALLRFKNKGLKNHYINFLRENDVNFVDCALPLTPNMKVPGEGHPNGKMNSVWADCIAASDVSIRVSDKITRRSANFDQN